MVGRNVAIDKQAVAAGYNPPGRFPFRMEITAEFSPLLTMPFNIRTDS
jgi:hypothetical protein